MRPCTCRGRTRGFTLVEVLIVVAVIAVLLAMLLPAVQSIRSAARRTDCGNNLRQLAKGITSFHSRNGALPTFWGPYPRTGNRTAAPVFASWLGHILPDLEMQADYLRLPKAKLCLGYRRNENVPGNTADGAAIIDLATALRLTEEDGVTFNIHDSQRAGQGNFEGNVNAVGRVPTGTIPGYYTVSSTITVPTYRYDRVLETAFGMNGTRYDVWRTVPVQIGTEQRVTPPRWVPPEVRYASVDPRYGGQWERKDFTHVAAYFNLSGSTPYGKGYPAAQETITVPLTVCKGDNSVIESSRKLRWLGGRDWSTTNYLANPHVFAQVSGTEATVTVSGGMLTADSPMGTGRYRIQGWGQQSFDSIKDGQTNTILLTEGMRYCSSVAYVSGAAFPVPENKYIEIARLAFWSSPHLSTPVDMGINPNQTQAGLPWAYSVQVHLAIQPHPNWAGVPYGGDLGAMTMPVPPDVSWKPWTHSFGVEWERVSYAQYANTFMFQSQPKPVDCSSIRAQSNHGDVLMVAMCDGSVRQVKSSISRRERSDSDRDGKEVGRDPNMGGGVDRFGKSTQPDGAWDMMMRANDGMSPPSQ